MKLLVFLAVKPWNALMPDYRRDAAKQCIVKLVQFAAGESWNKTLPDSGFASRVQWMASFVPAIKISNHRHGFGIRRPHGEGYAFLSINIPQMGSQLLVKPIV